MVRPPLFQLCLKYFPGGNLQSVDRQSSGLLLPLIWSPKWYCQCTYLIWLQTSLTCFQVLVLCHPGACSRAFLKGSRDVAKKTVPCCFMQWPWCWTGWSFLASSFRISIFYWIVKHGCLKISDRHSWCPLKMKCSSLTEGQAWNVALCFPAPWWVMLKIEGN